MDLSNLDTALADAGVVMQLKHPVTDDPLVDEETGEPITLTVLGTDSKKYRAHQRERLNRSLNGTKKQVVTAEQMDADNLALFVALTVGWSHIQFDGEKQTFSEPNVRKFYVRFPWAREQADRFIGDRSNFLKVSPAS